jgi:hypothetical protein
MRYKFRKLDFWEEIKSAVGDRPVNVIDSGEEIIFDFGDYELTASEEASLNKLMMTKPLLRGKPARLIEKGLDVTLTTALRS